MASIGFWDLGFLRGFLRRRSIEDVSTGESTPQGVAVDTNGEQAGDG